MTNGAENGAIVAGKAAAYGGATGAFVSGLTVSEWGEQTCKRHYLQR